MMLLAVAVVIALLQALTVGAFLWQRRCRRIADEEAALRRNELARAGRFALAGELSASIAHEVGQPLGAILSNADAAGMMLEDEWQIGELHSILADIRRDALRANQVVQGLRALLQKHTPVLGEIDLNETLGEALTLIRLESRRRRISIESNLMAGNAEVRGDAVQLQQVLLNLAINAMDAMENTADLDRVMTVTTRTAGQGYEFTVEDRGHGIPPEAKQRLFDSLYTTKPHGMGLGLSIVHTIVVAHGGIVYAMPREGGGSVFTVWLPRAAPCVEAEIDNRVARASFVSHAATQGGRP
ncbi:signal transduction histidine kinase [Paraburkholderia sp. GAS199]|uniref:sensor histidine kinase n=1 Tax=Paraburkholderia sp. GAS199 TaxID=3035126 RepID=UPI003D1DD432